MRSQRQREYQFARNRHVYDYLLVFIVSPTLSVLLNRVTKHYISPAANVVHET